MKNLFLLLPFLSICQLPFAQLNCKTFKGKAGDSTICYHSNRKISTIDWASTKHQNYYYFRAFDQSGNVVFEADHGYLHGGAGLYIKYYPNGAIQSARKTFQPDGGIQHYDATSFFNEDGTFNHEENNSWDIEHVLKEFEPTPMPVEVIKKIPEKVADSLSCIIFNSTGKKIKLLVGEKNSTSQKKVIILKKNDQYTLGKYLPQQSKIDPQLYFEIDLIPRKNFSTSITSAPHPTDYLSYYVFILKDVE